MAGGHIGHPMIQPINDAVDWHVAFNDAAEKIDEIMVGLRRAAANPGVTGREMGERAKVLDEYAICANYIGYMRDILLRQLVRQGWRPTMIEKTFGVPKMTVSRALRK